MSQWSLLAGCFALARDFRMSGFGSLRGSVVVCQVLTRGLPAGIPVVRALSVVFDVMFLPSLAILMLAADEFALLPAFFVLIGIILEAVVLRRFMRSQRREWRIPLLALKTNVIPETKTYRSGRGRRIAPLQETCPGRRVCQCLPPKMTVTAISLALPGSHTASITV